MKAIERIHLEITSRCTLACPQCPRTEFKDLNIISDMPIETAAAACKGYNHMYIVGNHGDPIYHPKFHELMSRLREDNPLLTFYFHTNGSFRSEKWWIKTANILNHLDEIVFSIDGLPGNDLYRVNSRWSSIELGIKTLRKHNTKLKMTWKWIHFKYNQNDVESAIDIAKDLGFDQFCFVESDRTQDGHWLTPEISWKSVKDKLYASCRS